MAGTRYAYDAAVALARLLDFLRLGTGLLGVVARYRRYRWKMDYIFTANSCDIWMEMNRSLGSEGLLGHKRYYGRVITEGGFWG
jgi:hypothetical protein